MPSSVVHVAVGILFAFLLLDAAYSRRAVLVVAAASIVPNLDVFVGLVVPNAHRAALHNVFVPLVLACALVYDWRVRERSWLRARFGPHAGRVAAVSLLALAVAGTGLDFVTSGVNLFYPVHDQFYTFSGKLRFSTTRGLVQTFVQPPHGPPPTTGNTHYGSVVTPTPPGSSVSHPERIVDVVDGGWQLWLCLVGYATLVYRFWIDPPAADTS